MNVTWRQKRISWIFQSLLLRIIDVEFTVDRNTLVFATNRLNNEKEYMYNIEDKFLYEDSGNLDTCIGNLWRIERNGSKSVS